MAQQTLSGNPPEQPGDYAVDIYEDSARIVREAGLEVGSWFFDTTTTTYFCIDTLEYDTVEAYSRYGEIYEGDVVDLAGSLDVDEFLPVPDRIVKHANVISVRFAASVLKDYLNSLGRTHEWHGLDSIDTVHEAAAAIDFAKFALDDGCHPEEFVMDTDGGDGDE
jgi:hypothetical protein